MHLLYMQLTLTCVRTCYCKGETDISDCLKYNYLHCFVSAEFILKMDMKTFIKITLKKPNQNKKCFFRMHPIFVF